MPTTIYPAAFTNQIYSPAKSLNMAIEIDGLSDIYCLAPIYKTIAYGDPGLVYGGTGLYYGGLALNSNGKAYISFDSQMNFSQKLEPEQGRASISTFTIILIDKNGEVSNVVSPGGTILPEILGSDCTIRIGFQNTSYPNDYYVAFRGIITQVVSQSGKISLSIGDANQKRRSAVFMVQKSILSTGIDAVTTSIPVIDSTNFYTRILGPDGNYDPAVNMYIQIDDEIMSYASLTTTTITASARGSRSTIAAVHNAGTDVTHSVQLQDHALTLALKIMLSGWNGPYLTGVGYQAFGTTLDDPSKLNSIVLPKTKNANLDYGLTIGDYVTISGSTSGNNGQYIITNIERAQGTDGIVLRVSSNLALESGTPAVLAFRSKYDTLPIGCGLQLSPQVVDVEGHENLRDNFIPTAEYTQQIYINSQQTGKDFIEQQLYLPVGCYSLTRYGRLSVNQTRPPIATQTLQFLNISNVLDPTSITNTRSLNTRKFFNEIQFQYDQNDDGTYSSVLRALDTDSLNLIGILSLLPINSSGLKTSLGAATLVSKVSIKMLSRYKKAAYEIKMKLNFQVGSQIEVGDVVVIQDAGYLQITNYDTGLRNLGTQLFEVVDRSFDIKSGVVSVTLISGVTGTAQDRYGTVAPSSIIAAGSTQNILKVNTSYAANSTNDETIKWKDYIGLPVIVRNDDWSVTGAANIVSVDNTTTPYIINVNAGLGFTPSAGNIVEIPYYPSATAQGVNQLYKVIHCFQDPTVAATATSSTAFTVSSSDISKFHTSAVVYIRDSTFTNISPNFTITSVNTGTNTITSSTGFGFTPTGAGYFAELIGFADSGAGYRIY